MESGCSSFILLLSPDFKWFKIEREKAATKSSCQIPTLRRQRTLFESLCKDSNPQRGLFPGRNFKDLDQTYLNVSEVWLHESRKWQKMAENLNWKRVPLTAEIWCSLYNIGMLLNLRWWQIIRFHLVLPSSLHENWPCFRLVKIFGLGNRKCVHRPIVLRAVSVPDCLATDAEYVHPSRDAAENYTLVQRGQEISQIKSCYETVVSPF
jgi:hypothetical protein